LLARGDNVRSFSRSRHDVLDSRVEQVQGDLANVTDVANACTDCDAVIHVAAKAGVWGPRSEYENVNVKGTRNIIAACWQHEIRKLVFTSTPSVVSTGRDIEGGNESLPYSSRFLAEYPRSKAIAEYDVIVANSRKLATVSLRPHLIIGPGDPHIVPRLLSRARAGKLKIVGNGKNRVDVTHVENAAVAHLLALDRLAPGSPIAGKTYFISQGEPVELWPFVNRILAANSLPPVAKRVPFQVAYAAGGVFEGMYRSLRWRDEPPMTRFVATQLAHSHWFNISAAWRDLEYEPHFPLEFSIATTSANH
jgi:nucleoside-diphosphate-sugar epimerase